MALRRFESFLSEADQYFAPARPSGCDVTYYAMTPKGNRALFTRVISLMQIRYAMSETSIQWYLKSQHPGCDIIIQRLNFR